MDLFECIQKRRSARRFTEDKIEDQVIYKALEAAILAPNSSNMQTWRFHWIRTPEIHQKMVDYCLRQSAARKAQTLMVVSANASLWKVAQKDMLAYCETHEVPAAVFTYYKKLIPVTYRRGFLNIYALFKWIFTSSYGLFKPMVRGPLGKRDLQEVAVKSAALACENFVLAIQAQGFDTCMMEGFDEKRVKSLLSLPSSARVVMVIAIGKASEDATWGERRRLKLEDVLEEV